MKIVCSDCKYCLSFLEHGLKTCPNCGSTNLVKKRELLFKMADHNFWILITIILGAVVLTVLIVSIFVLFYIIPTSIGLFLFFFINDLLLIGIYILLVYLLKLTNADLSRKIQIFFVWTLFIPGLLGYLLGRFVIGPYSVYLGIPTLIFYLVVAIIGIKKAILEKRRRQQSPKKLSK